MSLSNLHDEGSVGMENTSMVIDNSVMNASSAIGPEIIAPIAIAVIVVLMMALTMAMLRNNYIKVPPNQVAVVSGRKRKMKISATESVDVGYRLIKGGAAFVWPFFERLDTLDLRSMSIQNLDVKSVITKEGVPVSVKAVANIKIGSEDTLLSNAVERLLGKTQKEVMDMAYETLEGHLRAILGKLTVEQVYGDRAMFGSQMVTESQADLAKLGLKIDVLTIKELKDEQGYLDALGRKRTEEVKRDAEIGSAEAKREATIKATTAQKDGEIANQANLTLRAEAEKLRHVKEALYQAEVQAEQARANQAGPIAQAEREKALITARTEVAREDALRKEQELVASVIKPAEAKKQADTIGAEAEAAIVGINAAAEKSRVETISLGQATAIKNQAIAEADAIKVKALAEAEGVKAKLLAEADGKKAALLAEAEGILKKAEAYQKLDESGRLLQILEAINILVPNAIEKLGPVMKEIAYPLGNIEKVVMIDGGGNSKDAPLARFAGQVPATLLGVVEKMAAMDIDVAGLLEKVGVAMKKEDA